MKSNATPSSSLIEIFRALHTHRSLLVQITKREVLGRYRGSMIGIGWSFLNPVLMLCVYTFVFSVVFNAKWGVTLGGEEEGKGVFATVLFIGLMIHGLFAEVLTRSPSLVVGNVNYVKKVIFPLDILPASVIFSALIHAGISFLVWLLAYLILIGLPDWHMLFFPLVILPLVILSLGLSFILASLGVFIRDIGQTMGILATVLLFMSPVFFPLDRLPEQYQPFFLANPLTFIIQQAREVLMWKEYPDFYGLSVYMLIATLFLWLGFAWFQKTRKGFADVL